MLLSRRRTVEIATLLVGLMSVPGAGCRVEPEEETAMPWLMPDGWNCGADPWAPGCEPECFWDEDCEPEGPSCVSGSCIDGRCQQFFDDALCVDAISCTVDRCTLDGCENLPDDELCLDGVACTVGVCGEEGCLHLPADSLCVPDSACQAGLCTVAEGCVFQRIPDCCTAEDPFCGDGDPCTADSCDVDTMTCLHQLVPPCCTTHDDCEPPATLCSDGTCLPPGDPAEDYPFPTAATRITTMSLGSTLNDPFCCADMNGDGQLDNTLARLLLFLEATDADYQQALFEGELPLLLAYRGVPPETPLPPSFEVDAFEGYPAAGMKEPVFLVGTEGFSQWTALPRSSFGAGEYADPQLSAGPGVLVADWLLTVFLGSVDQPLGLRIRGARVTGAPVQVAPGFGLANGMLSGYVRRAELFAALNAWVEQRCDCLGLDGPLIDHSGAEPVCNVGRSSGALCAGTDPQCQTVYGRCLPLTMVAEPDVDGDGDGHPDSLSLGLVFGGEGAAILGLVSE